MKIYCLSPYDVFRARTNAIGDVHLCEGFAENGCEVELIAPYVYRKDNMKWKEIFSYYGVTTYYRITLLKTLLWDDIPGWVRLPILFLYHWFIFLRIVIVNRSRLFEVIIISRDVNLLIPSLLLRKLFRIFIEPKVLLWAHEIIFSKRRYIWVYRNVDGIVGTNSAIIRDFSHVLHIPNNKLAISLNPITETQICNCVERNVARRRLGLNINKPLIVYTGKLYIGQKEAEYILEAARQLPQYQFLLTGGKPEVVVYYKQWCWEQGISNIFFTGFLHKYDDVRYYQYAADTLISYYSFHDHMLQYNLPNKICEYMLTRNPIITCDFPAIRDILNDSNAIFVERDNPDALVGGIKRAVENRKEAHHLAEQAFQDVKQMTFKKRTKVLLDFFRTLYCF